MAIGQRKENSIRIRFESLHDSTNELKEMQLRGLLDQISNHITKVLSDLKYGETEDIYGWIEEI